MRFKLNQDYSLESYWDIIFTGPRTHQLFGWSRVGNNSIIWSLVWIGFSITARVGLCLLFQFFGLCSGTRDLKKKVHNIVKMKTKNIYLSISKCVYMLILQNLQIYNLYIYIQIFLIIASVYGLINFLWCFGFKCCVK